MVLNTQRQVRLTKFIPAPVETTLRWVQNPENIIGLSPLVVRKGPVDDLRLVWEITERMPVTRNTTSFTTHFSKLPDGLEACTTAALGTRLTARWSVKGVDGGTEVEEVVQINALFCFMPYIAVVMTNAHVKCLEALASHAREGGLLSKD